MTAAPLALVDRNGRTIRVGAKLAAGGEGTVYTLTHDPAVVVKVYHRPPSQQTVSKLAAMVRLGNPRLLKLAAWPLELAYLPGALQVAGFTMPRVTGFEPIQHLYNPVQRLKFFPRAGWDFQVRAALNLAAAFDEVHQAGCLIGDVNQNNALVSPQALVQLIDCDSFQVPGDGKPYLCEVGVSHYTPPELQGRALRGLERTENHDRFGLAVLIYQLLFVGRHPYAGVYTGSGDPSFEQMIAEYRFAQGPAAASWNMAPPPCTPTFDAIPPELGQLFRRAFERGSEAGARPRATDWIGVLDQLGHAMQECAADAGHKFWRGARACIWCRLAEGGGPEYFFGVAGDIGTFTLDQAKLREVLKRLKACKKNRFDLDAASIDIKVSVEPRPLPSNLNAANWGIFGLVLLCVLSLCALPLGFLQWQLSCGSFGAFLFFVIVLWLYVQRTPMFQEMRRRRQEARRAQLQLKEAQAAWVERADQFEHEFAASTRMLEHMIAQWQELEPRYQAELKQLASTAEAAARLRYLRLHLIADAEIPKIGAGRIQTLAAHHIYTAAEVDAEAILAIKGFGGVLTQNLLAWKEGVLRGFHFDSGAAVAPAEKRALTLTYRARQNHSVAAVEQQLSHLSKLGPECKAAMQVLNARVKQAMKEYAQASADLAMVEEYEQDPY